MRQRRGKGGSGEVNRTAPPNGLKLLDRVPDSKSDRLPEKKPSFILQEGKKAHEGQSPYSKPLYFTWNSIPIRYTFHIAWELGKAILRRMFSRSQSEAELPRFELHPS
jgi:hypothetical protein